ncbi:MAG: hypothetical protein SYR96_12740 [Actinomycetota bacterium]|nr:hypothetical protein [Actinomycetota bacterium]
MSGLEAHRAAFVSVLDGMLSHPQGHHGWNSFYEALRLTVSSPSCPIPEPLLRCWTERPELNLAHVATLLGMAVRQVAALEESAAAVFRTDHSPRMRAAALRHVLETRSRHIGRTLLDRHNSFTGARRFLLPQLVIGNYAPATGSPVRFLDVGTGLGVLPRQLNQRAAFERFGADLTWECESLTYREIPIECRHAIDKPPLPDLNWVRNCFGPSHYYQDRLEELLWSLRLPVEGPPIRTTALDILDAGTFEQFLEAGRYNAVTCNFVLYQYEPEVRRAVIASIVRNLPRGGIFLNIDLDPSMARPGCRIIAHLGGRDDTLHLLDVSDAHLIGSVRAGADYEEFLKICKL